MFRDVPSGLVVASSDVLLLVPDTFPRDWPQKGATGLAIPTDAETGKNHGVYAVAPPTRLGGASPVTKFFQKASVAEMTAAGAVRPDGTVLIDSGVIYFSPPATAQLLELAVTHPFESCTYQGLDCDRRALRIELYSDIMMAMGGGLGLSHAEYKTIASSETRLDILALARDVLWSKLRRMAFYAATAEGGDFAHVGTTSEYLQLLTAPTVSQQRHGLLSHAAWYCDGADVAGTSGCIPPIVAPGAVSSSVLNSLITVKGLLSDGSVLEHSELTGEWRIGKGCLVSSVRSLPYLTVRDSIAVQELRVPARRGRVLTVLAASDPVKDPFTKNSARVCGATWSDFFSQAGCESSDVWPGGLLADPAACTLWTAKLWPVFAVGGATGDASASVLGLGFGGGSMGGYGSGGEIAGEAAPCDPVTADRASLWMQWLAVPESGPQAEAFAASLGITIDTLVATRRQHLSPRVLSAWRSAARLSLRDILAEADADVEFKWRRALRGRIDVALLVTSVARGGSVSVADIVRRLGHAAALTTEGFGAVPPSSSDRDPAAYARAALRALDAVASAAPPDVAGRALAVQSALLWAMAGWGAHGHRSGPAHNSAWLPVLALLDGDANAGEGGSSSSSSGRAAAISALGALRDAWLHRAHLTGRAARHYERAAQLLSAQCVYTAPVAPPTPSQVSLVGGPWLVGRCPVRIDLAGGWSDTPPVTFEARPNVAYDASTNKDMLSVCAAAGGGLVVNCAVKVDGMVSLGARARLVARGIGPNAPLVIVRTRATPKNVGNNNANDDNDVSFTTATAMSMEEKDSAPGVVVATTVLTCLSDLRDYNQPHAEGALVKSALLALGVVRLSGKPVPQELETQLALAFNNSATATTTSVCLEIETWSLIPLGSGLGTSSILAGAVLAVLSRTLGQTRSRTDITHLVLKLEQMLTTGGGWQDQVGGLWPGVKASSCAARLPVCVRVFALDEDSSSSSSSTVVGASQPGGVDAGASLGASQLAPPAIVTFLDSHLFLLYTGRTRLAKNLLQRVLRQWAVRENGITDTVDALRSTAVDMAQALAARDAQRVGAALDAYWSQKKRMAPMAEPAEVTAMIEVLRPHITGASLCGAGGGGFLVGVTKIAGAAASGVLSDALANDVRTKDIPCSFHKCTVDCEGIVVE